MRSNQKGDAMKPTPTTPAQSPMSFYVSLGPERRGTDPIKAIRTALDQRADSVRVSVRGVSQAVDLLGRLKDAGLAVSAVLSIRGDKAVRT